MDDWRQELQPGFSSGYDDRVRTVERNELAKRLTSCLRRVRDGETLVVTEGGRAVAVLRPLRDGDGLPGIGDELASMALRGGLSLPTARPHARLGPACVAGASVSSAVIEDRR